MPSLSKVQLCGLITFITAMVILLGSCLLVGLVVSLGTAFQPAQNQQMPTTKVSPTHARSPPEQPRQNTAPQERWRAALRDGNGDDWLALSDRDRATLCVEAARVLERDNAFAYLEFLDSFYREGGVARRQKISETLAICTALIDRGVIDPEL